MAGSQQNEGLARSACLEIVALALGEDPATVSEGTALASLSTWDSIGLLSVAAAIDSQINRVLPPEMLVECQTLGDVVDLIVASAGS